MSLSKAAISILTLLVRFMPSHLFTTCCRAPPDLPRHQRLHRLQRDAAAAVPHVRAAAFYFTAYPNQTSSDPASPNYYAAYTGASAARDHHLRAFTHGGSQRVMLCIGHWQVWGEASTLSSCGPAPSSHCCLQINACLLHAKPMQLLRCESTIGCDACVGVPCRGDPEDPNP